MRIARSARRPGIVLWTISLIVQLLIAVSGLSATIIFAPKILVSDARQVQMPENGTVEKYGTCWNQPAVINLAQANRLNRDALKYSIGAIESLCWAMLILAVVQLLAYWLLAKETTGKEIDKEPGSA